MLVRADGFLLIEMNVFKQKRKRNLFLYKTSMFLMIWPAVYMYNGGQKSKDTCEILNFRHLVKLKPLKKNYIGMNLFVYE